MTKTSLGVPLRAVEATALYCGILSTLSFSAVGCGRNRTGSQDPKLVVTGSDFHTMPDSSRLREGYLVYPDSLKVAVSIPDTIRSAAMREQDAKSDSALAKNCHLKYIADESIIWSMRGFQPYFNCHTYALGEEAGLRPLYRVEGASVPGATIEARVDSLLSRHFVPIAQYPGSVEGIVQLMTDFGTKLHPDDRVFFVFDSGMHDIPIYYTHSGRLIAGQEGVSLRCKLGSAPLCEGPIASFLGLYVNEVNQVLVYRPRVNNEQTSKF